MAEGGGEAEIQRIALWRLGGRENGGLPTRPRATEVVGPFCFPAVFLCLKNAWWNVVEGGEAETGCFLFLPLSSFFTATTAENDRLQSSRPTLSLLRPAGALHNTHYSILTAAEMKAITGGGGRKKRRRNEIDGPFLPTSVFVRPSIPASFPFFFLWEKPCCFLWKRSRKRQARQGRQRRQRSSKKSAPKGRVEGE